jgi:hypothetical protein
MAPFGDLSMDAYKMLTGKISLSAAEIPALEAAAERGDAGAAGTLGGYYRGKSGRVEDQLLALKWFAIGSALAMRAGNRTQQMDIGRCYVVVEAELKVHWSDKVSEAQKKATEWVGAFRSRMG